MSTLDNAAARARQRGYSLSESHQIAQVGRQAAQQARDKGADPETAGFLAATEEAVRLRSKG